MGVPNKDWFTRFGIQLFEKVKLFLDINIFNCKLRAQKSVVQVVILENWMFRLLDEIIKK